MEVSPVVELEVIDASAPTVGESPVAEEAVAAAATDAPAKPTVAATKIADAEEKDEPEKKAAEAAAGEAIPEKEEWVVSPARQKVIERLVQDSLLRDTPRRRIHNKLCGGVQKVAYGLSYACNLPRVLDPEGTIREAAVTGATEAKSKFDDREAKLRRLLASARAGTLLTTHEFKNREELVDAILKLGVTRKEIRQCQEIIDLLNEQEAEAGAENTNRVRARASRFGRSRNQPSPA
jgi:hypothetical protein